MSHRKNGESQGTFSKWVKSTGVVFSTSLLMMTGVAGTASADYSNSCGFMDCCDMPEYVVYADFLYWQTNPEGLEFARSGFNPNATTAVDAGQIYAPGCEWSPGFRIGAIVDLSCCEWDFFAQYTWLHPNLSKSVADVANLQASSSSGLDGVALAAASGKYDLHFNVLDFGLGRTFNVNECFLFRPHFGFKATWQEAKYTVNYRDAGTATSIADAVNHKTNFNGIGLRGGFDAAWKFSPCFSIVGNLALSAVYSDIEVRRHDNETTTTGSTVSAVEITNQKFDACAVIPVLELFLGIRWDSTVCDCYDIFVALGWEEQVWFNYNRSIRETADAVGPHGALTFQGLTVRAGMGF